MRAESLRVHLVEDSPIMARLLRDLVSETPATVVGQSASAAAAIRDIARTKPDVAIVDIGLAQGNGFEVIEALAQRRPRPLVFVLTNHALQPYRERAARLGADAFFDKHDEIIGLLRALTSLADAYRTPSLSGTRGQLGTPQAPDG